MSKLPDSAEIAAVKDFDVLGSASNTRISGGLNPSTATSDAFAAMAAANSNLTKFGRTVTTTASTLVSSQYPDLSGTLYHDTMKDIIHKPAFKKRFFSFSRRAPSEVMRSTLSSKEDIKYRAITAIPEELFSQIPRINNQFSLFQGFQATTATLGLDQTDLDNLRTKTLTDGTTLGKPSRKKLLKEKDAIEHTLDLLEIRKDLAANEINEIDTKILYLQSNREIVFERVASLEQEEFQLENKMRHINMQLELISDDEDDEDDAQNENDDSNRDVKNNSVGSKSAVSSSDGKKAKGKIQQQNDSELDLSNTDQDEPLLSKSIFGKLSQSKQQNENSSNSKTKFRRQSTSHRKTQPTLQQYYHPGDSIRTIKAHDDAITALQFDIPFGTMVSASVDDTCKVWDLGRGICLGQLKGHNAYVTCAHMDNNLLVTGSMDAAAKLWDLSSLDFDESEDYCVQTFESHLREITALHFHNDTLITGSADKTLRQWDLRSGRCLQTLDVLWAAAQSSSMPFSDNSSWKGQSSNYTTSNTSSAPFVGAVQCFDAALATGTADGIVRLWDLRSGQVQRSLIGHTGPVSCLQFDDMYLTTGSLDRSIRMWDLRMGSIVDAYSYDSPITSLQFDARKIVSTNNENTIKIYDRETGQHWTCGPGVKDPESKESIQFAMFKEGYIVEGRSNGTIGAWAC